MEKNQNRTGLVLGAILLTIGVLSLIGQFLDIGGIRIAGSFVTIAVGAAFFVGMALGGKRFGALAIPGSIIAGIGLISLFQDLFGMWETWTYAWGLIISFVGIGLVIFGMWSERTDLRERGWRVARVGLMLFLVFGAIFEVLFTVLGVSSGRGLFWPVVLILAGLVMLISRAAWLLRSPGVKYTPDLNLFWPVMLIGFGALWILITLGILPASQVLALVNLWPLLLVVAGVEILFGRRSAWPGAILSVAVVAILIFLAFSGPQLGLNFSPFWSIPSELNIENGPITERVMGSGSLKSETRPVSGFSQVNLSGMGDAEIVQGETESLTIEADDNLLPYITSEVRGNLLTIGIKRGVAIRPRKWIRYQISVKDLSTINVSGASTITARQLKSDRITLLSSGYGNFKLNKVQAQALIVSINGSGSVNLEGAADRLEIDINGAGNYDSPDFKSQSASVQINGFGRALLWVTDQLTTNISGFGFVNYYGDPGSVMQNTGGIGSVRRIGNK